MANKYTYQYVKELFSENNCELLSTEYINSKEKLHFRCGCGREDHKDLDHIKRNFICKYCALENRDSKRRLTIEDARMVFADNGCVLLEEEYTNVRTKMKCICKCGEIKYLRYDNVVKGSHCRECSYKKTSENLRKYSLEDMKEIFKDFNCELLSDTYLSVNQRVKYKCSCGTESTIRVSAFLSGARCMQCALEKRTGEGNYQWKPEKTNEERLKERKFRAYENWRKQVFERDNYTCDCCAQYGGSLAAHHLDGWHWCIEKRLDVSNGITLCKSCHTEFHDIYTKFNNTEAQYNEWIQNKRKQDAI